ncbi:MAG: ion transporter [Bacteroidales bacterium]|nr:ion transporter [Bacteroidales bacterium]
MKLKDSLVNAWWRLRKWADGVDWLGIARNIVGWIGRVLHGILFGWLLPKRYRGLKKQQIFEIIFKSDTPAGKKFDVWLLVLIVLNIVLLVVDSLTGTTTTMTSGAHMSVQFFVFKVLEWGFTILFTFEYYLRIYCLKHPMKYVLSFWGVVDFISIFPAYLSLLFPATQALTVLRLLRVMRIFRIFHLSRFQNEVFHLLAALRASAIKIMVFMLFVLVAAVILGTLMFSFESEVNPAFENILSGVYWAVVTITTVGYGDIAPVTVGGRFLAVLVMLLGYSIIAVPTGIVAGEVYAESKKPDRKQRLTAAQRDYDDETEAINN